MQDKTQEELNNYKKYAFRFSRTYQINLIYVEHTNSKSQIKFLEIGADNVGKYNRPFIHIIYNFKYNGKVILNLISGVSYDYRMLERSLLYEFRLRRLTTPVCKLKKYIDI